MSLCPALPYGAILELRHCRLEGASCHFIQRQLAMGLREDLNTVVAAITGGVGRLDEGGRLQIALTAQATMMDRVLPKRTGNQYACIVEFNSCDILGGYPETSL